MNQPTKSPVLIDVLRSCGVRLSVLQDAHLYMFDTNISMIIAGLGYDQSHGNQHHLDVTYNVIECTPSCMRGYLGILIAAARTHDIVDHKYMCAKKAAEMSRVLRMHISLFLSKFGMRGKLSHSAATDMAMWLINNSSWSKRADVKPPTKLHAELLDIMRDADWLEAIGAVGALRCYWYTIMRAGPVLDAQKIAGAIIEHYAAKLRHINAALATPAGKAIGESRHSTLAEIIKELCVRAESRRSLEWTCEPITRLLKVPATRAEYISSLAAVDVMNHRSMVPVLSYRYGK
jgi:hypothetical protein